MTFSNSMTSRLDRGLSGETLSRRAARFRCSKLVSTIGSGRSSAAGTAALTDQRSAAPARSLLKPYVRAEEPWFPQGSFFIEFELSWSLPSAASAPHPCKALDVVD